jgi:hypothetical protein
VTPAAEARPGHVAMPRWRRALTPVRAVVAIGLLAVALAAFITLARSAPRRAGTNLTTDTGFVIPLAAGQQLCEPGELVPGDTAALRVSASSGAQPGPRLDLSVTDARGTVSAGGVPAGWRSGTLTIPLSRVRQTVPGAQICLVNRGHLQVLFGGSVPDSNFYLALGGRPFNGRLRIEYMRPGSESWFSLLPTLMHRFSLAKADVVRHWAGSAAIVLMLLAIALAVRTALKHEVRRP